MAIRFTDVRTESNTTYFFLSNTVVADFDFILKNNGVTDYQFHKFKDFPSVLPAGTTVPEVKLIDLPHCTRLCHNPCVLVSNMNIDDLRKKLQSMLRNEDDALQKRKKETSKTALKNYDTDHKWHEGTIPVTQKG